MRKKWSYHPKNKVIHVVSDGTTVLTTVGIRATSRKENRHEAYA